MLNIVPPFFSIFLRRNREAVVRSVKYDNSFSSLFTAAVQFLLCLNFQCTCSDKTKFSECTDSMAAGVQWVLSLSLCVVGMRLAGSVSIPHPWAP